MGSRTPKGPGGESEENRDEPWQASDDSPPSPTAQQPTVADLARLRRESELLRRLVPIVERMAAREQATDAFGSATSEAVDWLDLYQTADRDAWVRTISRDPERIVYSLARALEGYISAAWRDEVFDSAVLSILQAAHAWLDRQFFAELERDGQP